MGGRHSNPPRAIMQVQLAAVFEPPSMGDAVSLLTSTADAVLPLEEPFCLQAHADTFKLLHTMIVKQMPLAESFDMQQYVWWLCGREGGNGDGLIIK